MTGSHQPRLKEAISQSLAGRTAELDLLPLSVEEIGAGIQDVPTDEILLRGFMPEAWASAVHPTDFHRNYFRTYVERDVRTLLPMEIKSSRTFHPALAKNLAPFQALVPESSQPLLIYDGPAYSDRGGVRCMNFRSLSAARLLDNGER